MAQDRIVLSFSFPKKLALDIQYMVKTKNDAIKSREIEAILRPHIPERNSSKSNA